MKSIVLFSILFVTSISLNAQVNTELRIYHRLATEAFQMNTTTQNYAAQDYQVTRLQYYLTRFTVVYDGGQELAVSDDSVALISADDGLYSTVQLGSLNITNVEGVRFNIGVYAPVNNGDPALFPPSHPLAPQAPTMHWGWASGYRFLVYEGVGGVSFSQIFQMHALGNANYFETSVTAVGQMVSGNLIIALDADYTRGMDNIDVAAGIIAHGVDGADLTVLENFRDYVFSQSTQTIVAGLNNDLAENNWTVSPNPTSGEILISGADLAQADGISVTDLMGKEIAVINVNAGEHPSMNIASAGVYFVNLLKDGSVISFKRIVKL